MCLVCRSVVSAEFGARVHCSVSRILQTAALPVEPRPDTGNTQEADQKPAGLSACQLQEPASVLVMQCCHVFIVLSTVFTQDFQNFTHLTHSLTLTPVMLSTHPAPSHTLLLQTRCVYTVLTDCDQLQLLSPSFSCCMETSQQFFCLSIDSVLQAENTFTLKKMWLLVLFHKHRGENIN